jgi:predicted nucleic acid-binding protein
VELADTSVWTNREKSAETDEDFSTRLLANEIATCPIVVMELLWTTRDPAEFAEFRVDLRALPQIAITGGVWERAMDVWHELAGLGRHRQVKIGDLLVAAAAETARIGVCHYDADFDVIASVTGQPVRVIAPLGSLQSPAGT